jgi:hypothetical protein
LTALVCAWPLAHAHVTVRGLRVPQAVVTTLPHSTLLGDMGGVEDLVTIVKGVDLTNAVAPLASTMLKGSTTAAVHVTADSMSPSEVSPLDVVEVVLFLLGRLCGAYAVPLVPAVWQSWSCGARCDNSRRYIACYGRLQTAARRTKPSLGVLVASRCCNRGCGTPRRMVPCRPSRKSSRPPSPLCGTPLSATKRASRGLSARYDVALALSRRRSLHRVCVAAPAAQFCVRVASPGWR